MQPDFEKTAARANRADFAIGTLQHACPKNPEQSLPLLARLELLPQQSDTDVRANSLRVLAQWDKAGRLAEPLVYKALINNSELGGMAINALSSSELESD